ncbi:glycoside hydrolase family 5 protein [Rhodopila sp.]|uniref:glycoside hydrolase family 5 protein n=1 Tax=Rhodopila sp. TaxID=2480087 RepID=UPI003D13A92D
MSYLKQAAAVLLLSAAIVTAPRQTDEAETRMATGCSAAGSSIGAEAGLMPPSGASRPALLPAGYLHTAGSQIVDQTGRPVRIASVGWFQGFENPDFAMQKIMQLGFNAVRISWVDATMRSDLQRIDRIVAAAAHHGIKVILDHHTNEAGTPADGYGAQQRNGLWYDSGPGTNGTNGTSVKGTVTQAVFQAHWVEVARRYAGNSTVIGFDLDNEPLMIPGGSTWGDGGVTDIRLMYQTVGNAILAANPDVLIIAEGPQNYPGRAPWGDLSNVRAAPVQLNRADRLVYSVHDYPTYVSGVKENSGRPKVAGMNRAWGFLVSEKIAPVWIGEMGANLDGTCCHENIAASQAWAATLVDYLNGKLASQGGPSFRGMEQGVSTDWWAWGNLTGQPLDGTLAPDGSRRPAQYAVYSQLAPGVVCRTGSPVATPG